MFQSRRSFLGAAATFAAVSAWGAAFLAAQIPGQGPTAPRPIDQFPRSPIGGSMPERRLTATERMKINQAEIRKKMTRLAEVVAELQSDFEANSTSTVLSMTAIRKSEEIEKLARDIKALVRG